VTNQSNTTTRPLILENDLLENEPPAAPRVRRVQPRVSSPGRAAREIPLESEDSGGNDSPSPGEARPGLQQPFSPSLGRQRASRRSRASAVGRLFLLLAALVLLGGLGASAWLFKDYLGRDSRFRIAAPGNIKATGLTEVSRAQMLPVFAEDIGRNIFFVPLSQRRRQLEEIPWIEKATVMRLFPDQIRVSVVERQPVAFTRSGSQIGLVDADGVLLAMPAAMMAQHHYSFPVVTGIDAHDPPAARQARMAVYQRLLAELDSNGQRISGQISEIDLTDPADAQVLMPEQGADILAHFGEDRFLERYQRYQAHIAEWRQKYPKLVAVDLRYDQQVVLSMPPGTSVAQAAADEQAASDAGDANQSASPAAASAGDANQSASPAAASAQPADQSPANQASGSKQAAEKRLALKGHDFSRAVSATSSKGALAPEGRSSPASPETPAFSAKAKPAKPAAKTQAGSKTATAQKKPKTSKPAAAKTRAAQENKKRAEAKRAALNTSKQKAAPTNRPAASAGLGQ
jgi:cell division protein FtsQ